MFLDEIDKICARTTEGGFRGGDVSREGVQRDLLPLIEGTTVTTKYGPVKTDHMLFIASGAFHLAKPSDLLPELQGRLPIRVELAPLSRDDLRRILTEPEHSLLKQYTALMGTEGVQLDFTDDAIDALAELAADINDRVENIGARRLHTVLERLLEEISFTATDRARRDGDGGRGLRERARGAAGAEGRSEPVHPVERAICQHTVKPGHEGVPLLVPEEPTAAEAIAAIGEELDVFDDWMDRYQYIIELGRKLPAFPRGLGRRRAPRAGCQSKVWMDASTARRQAVSGGRVGCGDRLGPGGAAAARLFRPHAGRDPRHRSGVPQGSWPDRGAVHQSRQRHRRDGAAHSRHRGGCLTKPRCPRPVDVAACVGGLRFAYPPYKFNVRAESG